MFMQYDQEAGEKAGEGTGISESGAYVGAMSALLGTANTGTKFVEFTMTTEQGQARYMKVYYEKADGTKCAGNGIINAIMGLLKLPVINTVQAQVDGEAVTIIPEFEDKPIGFVLQKVLYTKNDGKDGYKFDIRMPFSAKTRCTLKEALAQAPALTVDKMLETLTDKDERNQGQQQSTGGYDSMPPAGQFSDDVQF